MTSSYFSNAVTIYKFWIGNGFTPAQACGLLAQADAESSLNPNAIGDHDEAFGIHQWHSGRAKAIKKGCGVNLMMHPLPSLEDQLKAAFWELKGPEHLAMEKIMQAKTAFAAGSAACQFWERPGALGQPAKRGLEAEKWAVYFSEHPV